MHWVKIKGWCQKKSLFQGKTSLSSDLSVDLTVPLTKVGAKAGESLTLPPIHINYFSCSSFLSVCITLRRDYHAIMSVEAFGEDWKHVQCDGGYFSSCAISGNGHDGALYGSIMQLTMFLLISGNKSFCCKNSVIFSFHLLELHHTTQVRRLSYLF